MKLLFFFLPLVVWGADSNLKSGKEMVIEAQALLKSGVPVVDVRQEACEGYVKGATLISIDDLSKKDPAALKKVEEITKGAKDAKIAIYCKAGGRAQKAIGVLKEAGYKNLINLGGVDTFYDDKLMAKCAK